MIVQAFPTSRASRMRRLRPNRWLFLVVFTPVLVVGSVLGIDVAIAMSIGVCCGGAALMIMQR